MKALSLTALLVLPPTLALAFSTWVVRGSHLVPTGLVEGELRPCPPDVECLSSQVGGVEALPFEGDPDVALGAMVEFLRREARAELVEVRGDYVRAVFVRAFVKRMETVELHLRRDEGVFRVRALAHAAVPASGLVERIEEVSTGWAFVRERLRSERD